MSLTFPGLLLIGGLIWCTQGRPVLFRQVRVGYQGRPFTLIKFRTMREGQSLDIPDRPVAKGVPPERVTPLGRVLRRLAIDEWPQCWNVLLGEMSLVGPRPLPQGDLDDPRWLACEDATERAHRYTWLHERQTVRPGITGLWQISGMAEADFANWLRCDLAYIEQRSLWMDLEIIWKTPWAIVRGRLHPYKPRTAGGIGEHGDCTDDRKDAFPGSTD